jgi:protein-S-isoprenylcysteine O-methyltransferase Ste14
MDIFTAVYFVALVIEIIIRAPVDRKRRQEKMSERRVKAEEQLMIEKFGDQYQAYMQKVGAVLPRV